MFNTVSCSSSNAKSSQNFDGNIYTAVMVLRDVNKQKELETDIAQNLTKAVRKNEHLEHLFKWISNKLRAPAENV